MRKKLKNRGSALVEYAIILSFVSVIGFSFAGDKGFAGNINGIINSTTKILGQALGLQSFDEEALKKDLIGLKDSGYTTSKYGTHSVLGSFFKNEGFADGGYEASLTNSQKFKDDFLSKMNLGEIEPESWRFFNEVLPGEEYAYLMWSDSKWEDGDFISQPGNKTPLMYARINKKDNTVTYGVGYGNPLDVDDYDGRISGWNTGGGGMLYINESTADNFKIYNPWGNENEPLYKAPDSPVFTSDYNKAVSLYKDLKAATQK